MKKKLIIIAIWIMFVLILNYFDLLSLDINTVIKFASANKDYAYLLILGLWIVRLILFIPSTPLMILGGVCFNPAEAVFLSTVGMFLSETCVYIFSKSFAGNKVKNYLVNRQPDLTSLIEAYNYKLLALGVINPIAPADVICFLSASVGIKYSTYILTVIIASSPLRILYSFIGISLSESKIALALVIVSLVLVFTISIRIWNTLRSKKKNGVSTIT
ncbi:TVP38/TMEM64 family protein [Solibacillus daqui]|uniref:TVP38/TMEM64 family protein n=1 Tax=Solibacillus daqui TaxID=2912187 RepID=UPI0023651879|nr:VTT domain-containing protein [Solibacillus daqui]